MIWSLNSKLNPEKEIKFNYVDEMVTIAIVILVGLNTPMLMWAFIKQEEHFEERCI